MADNQGKPSVIEAASSFILETIKDTQPRPNGAPPLFIGIQGPQGIGKSYLTNGLYESLSSEPHNLRLAFISLDDLYSTHKDLVNLKNNNPTNKLLHGRGLPGTHDLPLARSVLEKLHKINQIPDIEFELPSYDKSLHSGQGDRSTETNKVKGPIDLVIFEGWMVGFYPITTVLLKQEYERQAKRHPNRAPGDGPPFFLDHSEHDLLAINELLEPYSEGLWPFLNALIHLNPVDLQFTFDWRLEQEHNMKKKNNGNGMTDEQVKDFVARYMPAYELFGKGVTIGYGEESLLPVPWKERYLNLLIGRHRNIEKIERNT